MPNRRRTTHPLNQSPLFKLRSRSKLATVLDISLNELRSLSKSDALYTQFDIEKPAGGTRHVENPARRLKIVQARLARILSRITPPDFLFCPVKGRSYISNAAQHSENRVIQSLDVKRYFPSTSSKRVFWFYNRVMLCERDIAGLLTKLSTFQEHLPTGSPLSPILAFFAHYDLWADVAKFCTSRGHKLTVYIDDCTVSGAKVPERDMWEIRKLIHRAGLRYHKEKRFIDRAAEVTGVIVTTSGLKAPHRQFRKLRQSTEQLALAAPSEIDQVRSRNAGLQNQIQQIRNAKPT